jgi:hypothetical protein
VHNNPGNLGYPHRIKTIKRDKEGILNDERIWHKTQKIRKMKERLQHDLALTINENNLDFTLKETED